MKFIAKHISFQEIDGAFVFALGDKPGCPGEEQPEVYALIQFGDEGEQDRSLGLTGLYIETSRGAHDGYGKVRQIAYDGQTVSIIATDGTCLIEAIVDTDMMTKESIDEAVSQCNHANATRPQARKNECEPAHRVKGP
ncbi:MAG: hypothetical protein WAT93_06785 [Pontixanthobacter sp.]